jgi:hypothetical protein
MFAHGKNRGCMGVADPGDPGMTPLRWRIVRVIADSLRSKEYPPSRRQPPSGCPARIKTKPTRGPRWPMSASQMFR